MSFKVGDRVALKGRVYPIMLVTAIEGETVLCRWQLEGRSCSAGYLMADLIKVEQTETSRQQRYVDGEAKG